MGKRKILRRLARDFGTVPGVYYFPGDMENITSYYDYRRDHCYDDFLLDETTWYDLGMDDIFRRMNPGLTTSGEQYLYYMLRHPATSKEDYDERRTLIAQMADKPALRLKLQQILCRLGRSRNAVLCQPEIDFAEDAPAFFDATGMVHPMIHNPVANDLKTTEPILITGSNASVHSVSIPIKGTLIIAPT